MADNKGTYGYSGANDTEFFTVEAYKLARTNIALSIIKQGCKKVVITSANAHEGKTTTSCNVAAAFSKHINCRTIIIDCDLRKPTVAKFFKLRNNPGLTNYLSGLATLDEIIQVVPNTSLSVITSGIIPPNPSELLSSDEFKKLVDELSQSYDYIVFDTTPLNVIVDAIPVAQLSDGVVIVTYEGRTSVNEIDKTVDIIKRAGAKIIGFILNGSRKKENNGRYYKAYK